MSFHYLPPTTNGRVKDAKEVYTQTAIDVRNASIAVWERLVEAGAPQPEWPGGPAVWVSKDRHRAMARACAAGFPTSEVKAAERTYERAFAVCVKKNMGLIFKVSSKLAKRGRARGLEQEDLVQEGVLGMQRALETFDPEKKVSFSTYSYFWIYQTIDRAINNSGTIRVPIRTQDLAARGKKEGKLADRAREASQVASLDAEIVSNGAGASKSLMDVVACHRPSPEQSSMQTEDHESLNRALATLSDKELLIIQERYVGEKTLEEVGAMISLTRERVRQIEAEAVEKLRSFCTFSRTGFNT